MPVSNGFASIIATLNSGTQTIIATYSGDPSDMASTSFPVAITVNASAPPPAAPQDFSLQLAQPVITLAPGTSGQIGFTITPQNGFDQQVKLSCSGLPVGGNCSFSPLTSTAPTSGSMMITMASSTATAALLPFSCVLLRRRCKRLSVRLATAAFLILIAGCGAGVFQTIGTTPSAGPVPGNYAIQVIAVTAGGLTHAQSMTLTVQ